MLAGSQTQCGVTSALVLPGYTSAPDSFPRFCPGTSGWKKARFLSMIRKKTNVTSEFNPCGFLADRKEIRSDSEFVGRRPF